MLRQRGFRWALLVSIAAHIAVCLTVPIADKSGENAQPLVQHVKEAAIEFVRIIKPKPPPPPKIKKAPRRHEVVRRRVRRRVAKRPRRQLVQAPQREALKPPEEPRVAEVPLLPEEKSVPEFEVLPPVPVEELREPELTVPQPKPVIVRPTPVSDVLPQPEAIPEVEKAVPEMVVAVSPTASSRTGSVASGGEMASVPMHVADSGVGKSPEPPAPKPTEIALAPSIAASPGQEAPGSLAREVGESLGKAAPAFDARGSRSPQVGSETVAKAPRHSADAEPVGTPLGSTRRASGSGPIAPTKPGPAGPRLVGGRQGIALGDPDAAGGPRGPQDARPRGQKAAPRRNGGVMPLGTPADAAGARGHAAAGSGDVKSDGPVRMATRQGGTAPVWAGHAGAGGAGRPSGGGGGTRIALVGREQPGGGGEGKAGQPWSGSGVGKAAPRLGGRAGTGPAIFGAPEKSAGGRDGREGDGWGTGPVRYDVAFGRPDGTGGPGLPGVRPTLTSRGKLGGDGPVGPDVSGNGWLEPGAKAEPEGMWRIVRMPLRVGGEKPSVGERDRGGPGTGAGVGIGQPLDAGAGLVGPAGLGTGPHGPSLGDLAFRALRSLGMPGLSGGTKPGLGQGPGSAPGKGTPFTVAPLGPLAGHPTAGRGATGGSGGARGTGRDVEEPVASGVIERRGDGWHGTGLSRLPGSGNPVMSGGLGGGPGPTGFGTGLGESRAKGAPDDLYVGVAGSFDMPMGVTASDYQADAEGMRNLLAEVRKRTNVHVTVQDRFVPLTFDNIKHTPVLHLRGHRPFSFSDEQREALRQYVARGGTIVGEDSHGPFGECFGREMRKIFGRALEDLPEDHDLYRCYYVLDKIPAGDMGERYPLQGLQTGDRLGVIFSRNDYGDCWEGTGGWVKPESREPAFRMGVNMYIYAIAHWQKAHQ